MTLLDLASSQSFLKGMNYYEQRRVGKVLQINPQLFESEVKGSRGSIYDVTINLKQPRKSTCDCPFAEGRRVICKHMVATYFTQFPLEYQRVVKEIEGYEEEEEAERLEKEQETKDYVDSLSTKELRNRLLAYMLREIEGDGQF